ncbi:MAG: hypothetical protein JWQ57_2045 [Mucilaginibacter sp.]|nr:hypothetical protein [Mucilaginibacter sp.]
MALTLKNYTKELPKELLQLAEKNAVRECDEIEAGRFIAYVDEGSNSFDVSVIVLPGDKIGKSACDCGCNINFCRHKVALVSHLAKDQKLKSTVKLKKKESAAESLMDSVEFSMLKEWVTSLIQKNKDIELAFVHHFSAKNKQYNAEDVVKLIKDAIKATGCNKKNIDASQLKKLVDLWAEVLQPVVDCYHLGVMDEKAFQNLHTMLEYCYQFQSGINSTSVRIPKYIETVLKNSENALNILQNDGAWYRAAGFFIDHVFEGANNVRIHYLLHLQNIISTSSPERREKLIDLLAGQYKNINPELLFNGAPYTKIIFGLIETHNLFPKYYKIIKPIRFDNGFNQNLIRLLIENNHIELAGQYCREQIKLNYREEYNIIYLTLLKEIYTVQGDEENLAGVLTQLFPLEYNFDDYLFIIDRLPVDEQKAWRTRVLRNAGQASYGVKSEALIFRFKLMDYEKNHKKMIDYIDSDTPYGIILKYFEPMAAANKTRLLDVLSRKSDNVWLLSGIRKKDGDDCFPQLFDLAKKYYGAEYLIMVIKQIETGSRYYTTLNRFFTYIKQQLFI